MIIGSICKRHQGKNKNDQLKLVLKYYRARKKIDASWFEIFLHRQKKGKIREFHKIGND